MVQASLLVLYSPPHAHEVGVVIMQARQNRVFVGECAPTYIRTLISLYDPKRILCAMTTRNEFVDTRPNVGYVHPPVVDDACPVSVSLRLTHELLHEMGLSYPFHYSHFKLEVEEWQTWINWTHELMV